MDSGWICPKCQMPDFGHDRKTGDQCIICLSFLEKIPDGNMLRDQGMEAGAEG